MQEIKKFENSPEAQEYILKLQQDRVNLPPTASELEQHALTSFKELQQELRKIAISQGDISKQIEMLQTRHQQMDRDIGIISGQITAYANMLVKAESERRYKSNNEKLADNSKIVKIKNIDEECISKIN